ncbi:hypothetical protein BH10PSE4_BH10PSE4_30190 [soil metagenome]
MVARRDSADLVEAITALAPLALTEPVFVSRNGEDCFVVMPVKRYARLLALAPDPRRAVSLADLSDQDAEDILAAADQYFASASQADPERHQDLEEPSGR